MKSLTIHSRTDSESLDRREPSKLHARQVPAVTRAIAILRLLGKSDEPLGVNAIARELQLVPSTCLHILRVLVGEELVAFDPVTKRYGLNAGVLTIARSFMRRNSFSQVVQPSLDELSRRCGATALGLRVFGLDHMVAVAISRPELPLRLHFEIGTRLPALIGATGRCLAAFGGYPWNELRRRFRALRWYRAPSLRQWRAEIDATRERGYSIDQGNYAQGVTILGVPVLDSRGLMSYSITTASVSEQMAESGVIALAEEMRSIAGTISQQLRA